MSYLSCAALPVDCSWRRRRARLRGAARRGLRKGQAEKLPKPPKVRRGPCARARQPSNVMRRSARRPEGVREGVVNGVAQASRWSAGRGAHEALMKRLWNDARSPGGFRQTASDPSHAKAGPDRDERVRSPQSSERAADQSVERVVRTIVLTHAELVAEAEAPGAVRRVEAQASPAPGWSR